MAGSALDHAAEIIRKVQSLGGAFEPEPFLDEQAESRVLVRLTRRFEAGSRLAVTVLVDSAGGQLTWLKYRVHYMDAQNRMILRYDNTPHHGDLPGFPHHKHVGANEVVVDSDAPDIDVILGEIQAHLVA